MTEIEASPESAQETINEKALEFNDTRSKIVALSSAILAALAAVAALLAGHHSNEAMMDQVQASDQWGYFQAKSIKAAILNSKFQIMQSLGKTSEAADNEKFSEYKKDQDEIQNKAKELERSAKAHLEKHLILARAVTFFQVAIAVAAISILTRRRRYFTVSLGFGLCGLFFLIQGVFV